MNPESNELAKQLGAFLDKKQIVISCAESCTGGLLAAAITSVAGSSGWFEQGLVTYSNQAKVVYSKVNPHTLEKYGAVSQQTADEMARGALQACSHARLALSTTGIAGPGGGLPGKPVGLVWFGFAWHTDSNISVQAISQHFTGDRHSIREQAVNFSLLQALRLLNEQFV